MHFAWLATLLVIVGSACLWADEFRTWTDATGKFTISASLVSEADGKVVLKKPDGTEITLPIERLSNKDQQYLASLKESGDDQSKDRAERTSDPKDIPRLREMAESFYSALRSEGRGEATELLTEQAKGLVEAGESGLNALPSPDGSAKAIRIGKAKVTGKSATVAVVMLISGEPLRTTLHFRKKEDQWYVFGMSAKVRGQEVTIDLEKRFEKPTLPEPGEEAGDPLEALVGKPIDLTGVTLNGKPVSLKEFKGKVVLIDFWATWCGPCRAEIPNIAANYQRFKNSGFEVLAVSLDDDLEELRTFVAQENPPWIVLADSDPRNSTSMAAKFRVSSIPALVLVGRDGKVVAVNCRGPKLGQMLSLMLQ